MAKTESPTSVAVDACVLINWATGKGTYLSEIDSLFHESDRGQVRLFGSTMLYVECLGNSANEQFDQARENTILSLLDNPERFTMVALSRAAGMVARDLRREYGLRGADSVHLACAIFARVEIFMTIDAGFPIGQVVRGVRVDHPRPITGTEVLS